MLRAIYFALAIGLILGCSEMTVTGVSMSTQPRILNVEDIEVESGEAILVKGRNLDSNVEVTIDGKEVSWMLKDTGSADVVLPNRLPDGIFVMKFHYNSKEIAAYPLLNKASFDTVAKSDLPPENICNTYVMKNSRGSLVRGTRRCNLIVETCREEGEVGCVIPSTSTSVDVRDLARKVISGESVAGVEGEARTNLPECSESGHTLCTVRGPTLLAADISDLGANEIRDGVTIAGISGQLSGYPLKCSSDNQSACLAVEEYPAIDKLVTLQPNLHKIRSSVVIAGLSGSIPNCSVDGEDDCVPVGPSFAAGETSGAANKILIGSTLALIDGAAAPRPADCTLDAQVGCSASSTFPAISKSLVLSKQNSFTTDLSLAGLSGLLSECSSDGQVSCLARPSFPAIGKANLLTNSSQFRSSLTIANIQGTLPDCSLDGEVSCYALPTFPAFQKSIAAPKILSGTTLGLVAGTGAGRPLDCSTDGGLDCVATHLFPAMNKGGSAAKIISGQSVGGIAGSVHPRPANCIADGETDCVTSSNLPALSLASAQAAAPYVSSSLSLSGVAGLLNDCSDGDAGCLAKPPRFAAVEISSAAPKIMQGMSVAGINGSAIARPADCSSEGEVDCVANANYPALDSSNAASKIILSNVVGSVTGTAMSPRPSDCTVDGQENCVSVTDYPAMRKAGAEPKIAATATLGGVAGTGAVRPADCTSGNATNCVTTLAFPAVDKNRLSSNLANLSSDLSFVGLSGSLPNCSLDGQSACLSSASFPAASVSGAAPKILQGQTLAGVAGSGATTPALCASSEQTSCVTSAAYPSIDKSLFLSSLNKVKSDQTLLSVAGSLLNCTSDGQNSCVSTASYPAASATGAPAKILNLQTVAGIEGTAPAKPNDCTIDGQVGCVTVASFPSIEKTTITASKIRRNTTLAGVTGTLDDCNVDGAVNCVAIAAFPSAQVSGAASKILATNTLAGVAGSAVAKPNDCSMEGATGCVAVPSFPALDTSELSSQVSLIRNSATILSTTGTLADCATDGNQSCVTNASYPSALITGASAKIVTPHTLAGIAGVAVPKPVNCSSENEISCTAVTDFPSVIKANIDASKIHTSFTVGGVTGSLPNCSGDNQADCLSTSTYPSIIKSQVTEGVIKNGVTIAGVMGLYPSSTYPLTGATAGTSDDLGNFANFKSRLGTSNGSSTFEWFDSTGTKHTGDGDENFKAFNIKTGTNIFDVVGTYAKPSDCSSDGGTGCVTTSTWKAADTTHLTVTEVKHGSTVAGVSGQIRYANNRVDHTTYNRTTGPGADATGTPDVYDSVDDYDNGKIFTHTTNPWWTGDTSLWGFFDENGNGQCESGERCEFYDRMTKLSWIFFMTPVTWEQAITSCGTRAGGGFDGGRLPTQKEAMQLGINGIYAQAFRDPSNVLGLHSYWRWTATTHRNNFDSAWIHNPSLSLSGAAAAKSNTLRYSCVIWGVR